MKVKKIILAMVSTLILSIVAFGQTAYASNMPDVSVKLVSLTDENYENDDEYQYSIGNTSSSNSIIINRIGQINGTGYSRIYDAYCARANKGFENRSDIVYQTGENNNPYIDTYNAKINMVTQKSQIDTSILETMNTNVDTGVTAYDAILQLTNLFYLEEDNYETYKNGILKDAIVSARIFNEEIYSQVEEEDLLTVDQVRAIQQAALWYFTNYGETLYTDNVGSNLFVKLPSGVKSLSEAYVTSDGDHFISDEAIALYDYLVNTAIANAKAGKPIDNDVYLYTNTDASQKENTQPIIMIKKVNREFDLALRKYISSIDGTTTEGRNPKVDSDKLASGDDTTATYKHRKDPKTVEAGSKVCYKLVIYNEGEVNGRATKVIDQLPEGLRFNRVVSGNFVSDGTYSTSNNRLTLIRKNNNTNDLLAFDSNTMEEPDFEEIEIECLVVVNESEINEDTGVILTNIAWIEEHASNEGTFVDRDSNNSNATNGGSTTPYIPGELVTNGIGYYNETKNENKELSDRNNYFEGQEDDDDFEKIQVLSPKGEYDIVLVKEDKSGSPLEGENQTGTFEVTDENGKTTKTVNGTLPIVSDKIINLSNVSKVDTYIIKETIPPDKYCAFDGEIKIEVYKKKDGDKYVVDKDKIKYYVDDVEVTSNRTDLDVFLNTDGNIEVHVKDYQFDLALRKFITKINDTPITDREPSVTDAEKTKLGEKEATYDEGTTASKTHKKDKLDVTIGDRVEYTIRVYNEGEINGYASKVTDYLPAGLTFIEPGDVSDATHSKTNKDYGWEAEGQKVTTTKLNNQLINAFDENTKTLDYKDLKIECFVNENATATNLKNIAEITEHKDEKGRTTVTDRDSQPDNVTTNTNNYNPEAPTGGKGEQDDDDFEELKLKEFDLALRKFITKIATKSSDYAEYTEYTAEGNRVPKITGEQVIKDTETNAKETTTAEKQHTKDKLTVAKGDKVTYTIRVYNEGQVNGYAAEVTDYLPDGLSLVSNAQSTINTTYNWQETTDANGKTVIKSTYLKDNNKIITAANYDFNKLKTEGYYEDLLVECFVNENATKDNLRNIAAITKYENENGKEVSDKDSDKNPVNPDNYNPKNPTDGIGEQDDDDFEDLQLQELDLALRKFITRDADNADMTGATTYNRAPVPANLDELFDNDEVTTATYNHTKQPLKVNVGDYVEYTLRVYNEGSMDGYAREITDHLPEYLEYVDCEANKTTYKWNVSEDGRTVKTDYLKDTKLDALSDVYTGLIMPDGSLSGRIIRLDSTSKLDELELKIICKVVDTIPVETNQTNIAEITKYGDKDNTPLDVDRDSQTTGDGLVKLPSDSELPDYKKTEIERGDKYIPGQQDDDDFEKIYVPKFDLALRKFITKVEGKKDRDITDRVPQLSMGEDGNIKYDHTKEPVLVVKDDVVTYTLRIFNEGNESGYASVITDDIPNGVVFLPDNETNKQYRWVMYAELPEGVEVADPSKVVELNLNGESQVKKFVETTDASKAVIVRTDYLSKEQGETRMEAGSTVNPNLIKAFDEKAGLTDTNPDYKDIKVAFKVVEENGSEKILINYAQISDDQDEEGKPVKDIDSTPDRWNEGEDDQDIEKLRVPQFDLALRKWVTQAIVTENGQTTVTETGHDAWDDPEEIVKVELHRKKLSNVTVKFRYSIRVYNQGEIEGYAKEVTDYIPEGLKFVAEDNPDWTDEGNNVISTRKLENTLLQPGEFADVEVLLTWINGNDNLGLKVNTAEISEDENDWGVPDKDSTPDNKKPGEDDIDDAPVMLSVSTGAEATYIILGLSVLITIAGGVALIKKYVM